ncbi:MAG: ABC transporter ATP-binding protein [Proteobacteria bacterium]|nr:ABC transporter ATP-binding protein [Pseudomonadota bacterium]MBU4296424.1 ABC transporter ATP-binding protein [Pseudomonadota bacterium]
MSGNSRLPAQEQCPALSAVAVCKRYKNTLRPALDDFSLEVRQGEFFGLLGPNGAGKTTAIAILTGLMPPDSGTVRLMGMGYREKHHQIKQILGLVPQDIGLYDKLTARENLTFFGKLYGIKGKRLTEKIQRNLEFVSLTENAARPVATFSFGMKRRLNLAAGLLNDPQVLVLDEPCVGIDAQSRHLIHEQLRDLNRRGTTILYTTHYMEEAQELCGRLCIMDNGRPVAQGSPVALLRNSGMSTLEELFLHLTGKELRDV